MSYFLILYFKVKFFRSFVFFLLIMSLLVFVFFFICGVICFSSTFFLSLKRRNLISYWLSRTRNINYSSCLVSVVPSKFSYCNLWPEPPSATLKDSLQTVFALTSCTWLIIGLLVRLKILVILNNQSIATYAVQITGLKEALDHPNSGVTTIYSKEYFWKTWCCIKCYQGGHAVFTYPCAGGKCAGATQKIMYLADDYWRLVGT